MGSDDWDRFGQAMRQHSRLKRADNRESSARLLASKGYDFTVHNLGAHLVVGHRGVVVDFWPGTGKWIVRQRGLPEWWNPGWDSGRGVFPLIHMLKAADRNGAEYNSGEAAR